MVNNYLDILAKAQNPIVLTSWDKKPLEEYLSQAIGSAIHNGLVSFKLSFKLDSLNLSHLVNYSQSFIDGLAILYENYCHTSGDGLISDLVVTQHIIDSENNHTCISIPVTAKLTYNAQWVNPEEGEGYYSITNCHLAFVDSNGEDITDGNVSGILTMNFPANAVE